MNILHVGDYEMKAWFDLMIFPLTVLLIANFHWITDNLIYEMAAEKFVFENSRIAEDFANELLFGNCSSETHNLNYVSSPQGSYRIFRISVVDKSPRLITIGNNKG